MFAIIAALWSLFAMFICFSSWGWIEHQVLYQSKSWARSFTCWLIGSLLIWLVPIFLFKFFIYLFS